MRIYTVHLKKNFAYLTTSQKLDKPEMRSDSPKSANRWQIVINSSWTHVGWVHYDYDQSLHKFPKRCTCGSRRWIKKSTLGQTNR